MCAAETASTAYKPSKPPRSKQGVFTTMALLDDGAIHVDVNRGFNNAGHSGLYNHIPANHVKFNMQTCDPVFANPNSHDRVREVLRHIGKVAQVSRYTPGSSREVVYCSCVQWLTLCVGPEGNKGKPYLPLCTNIFSSEC